MSTTGDETIRAGDNRAGDSRATDNTVARLERLPFGRVHLRVAGLLGVGTFFDAFDSLVIATVLTVVISTFHVGFGSAGLLISAAYVGQFIGALTLGVVAEQRAGDRHLGAQPDARAAAAAPAADSKFHAARRPG